MLCILNYFLFRESKQEMLENHPVLEYIKDFEMEEKQEESTETEL